MSKIFKGQIGVKIELETSDNLAGATTLEIRYRKPDGSTGAWDATASGTKIFFTTTEATDLDQTGDWKFQASLAGTGIDLLGETAELTIYQRFG